MGVTSKHKPLSKIPTSRLGRGMRLASLTASVGAQALVGKMGSLFSDAAQKELKNLASKVRQARKIAETLGQMKGAAMKLGQILSIHGEHLFPKEVVEVLSSLQQNSEPMAFSAIEKMVRKELGPLYGSQLTHLSLEPIASASIGQVHSAVFCEQPALEQSRSAFKVAVKVQYPGVDTSIDSDVDSLASLLSVLTRLPSLAGFNSITDEIKAILTQETDYVQEGEHLDFFRDKFKNDARIVIPRYFPNISTKHILTTEYIEGRSIQDFLAQNPPQAARDALGKLFTEIFYSEILEFGRVQTDPNFANYKVLWDAGNPAESLKIVLLDFGSVKTFTPEFCRHYKEMIRGCLADDYDAIRDAAISAGFLTPDDPKEFVDLHYELVSMFREPCMGTLPYDWQRSDLPERIRKFGPKFIFAFKLRPPPRDFIFLNRKMIGLFFFCSTIGAKFNPREIVEAHLS